MIIDGKLRGLVGARRCFPCRSGTNFFRLSALAVRVGSRQRIEVPRNHCGGARRPGIMPVAGRFRHRLARRLGLGSNLTCRRTLGPDGEKSAGKALDLLELRVRVVVGVHQGSRMASSTPRTTPPTMYMNNERVPI